MSRNNLYVISRIKYATFSDLGGDEINSFIARLQKDIADNAPPGTVEARWSCEHEYGYYDDSWDVLYIVFYGKR